MVAVTVLSLVFLVIPGAPARAPYEHIIARYTHSPSGIVIIGNLTRSTDDWYMEAPRTLSFDLSAKIPNNMTLSVNVTRFVLFIEFPDESSVYILLNESDNVQTTRRNNGSVFNETLGVVVTASKLDFIPESSNWGILAFLVTADMVIQNTESSTRLQDVNIFSLRPQEVTWDWPFGLYIPDNKDDVYLYPFPDLLMNYIMFLALIGAILLLFVTCFRNSDSYRNWKSSRPQAYVHKAVEVHGKKYELGGLRTTLAYYMHGILPDGAPLYGKVISDWAKKSAGLDIPNDLDVDGLSKTNVELWSSLRDSLEVNARGISKYLYEQTPRGMRAKRLAQLLVSRGFTVDEDTRSWLSQHLDDEVEAEIEREFPSGNLFSEMRSFVESKLSLMVPDLLFQLRQSVDQAEKQTGPAMLSGMALTCRDVYEGLLDYITHNESIRMGKEKPEKGKTKDSARLVVAWLKSRLNGCAEVPLSNLDKGFDLFFAYTTELGRAIQRAVHKEKTSLLRQEILSLVVNLYSWIGNLFVLLERAGYDWA